MKKIFITALFITTAAYAEICLENNDEPSRLARSLSIPNCNTEENLEAVKAHELDPLCIDCKKRFEGMIGEVKKPSAEKLQKQFLDSALKEYKKTLITNLIAVTKLRTLPSTGGNFSKSIKSCKLQDAASMASGCRSKAGKKLLKESDLLKDLSNSISNELAMLLSKEESFKPQDALMTRNGSACFIPEEELLYLSSSAAEDQFSPEVIRFLQKVNPADLNSVEELFKLDQFKALFKGDQSQLYVTLRSHPLLGTKTADITAFINFFKTIRPPETVESLKASIYNDKAGRDFDENLSRSCESTYKNLIDAICSDKFEKGSLNTSPFENFEKLGFSQIPVTEDEFVTNEEGIAHNTEILSMCEVQDKEDDLDLTEVNKNITPALFPEYQEMSFKDFGAKKYDHELGQLKQYICQNKDKGCSDDSINCKILKKFQKKASDPESLDAKLASSSNEGVNELLRSMIGKTSTLDPRTKEILVSSGILPKADGTIVAQPEIPERAPDYFQKEVQKQARAAGARPSPATPPKTQRTTFTPPAERSRSNAHAQSDSSQYSYIGDTNAPSAPEGLDDLARDAEELRKVQDEIRRRLTDLPKNETPTPAQAKKIARDSFRTRGRSLTPLQENYIADRIMNAPMPAASPFQNTPSDGRRAEISGGDSEVERWKKNRMNEALMGMAGARQSASGPEGRSPASDDAAPPKELTKVALNLTEDPQITLGDIFKNKLDQNDSETQLLKVLLNSKSNFLLQVKSMNFKVVFNSKDNKFNLLLQSGDSREAERIRPQLEMFLRRLRA